MFIKIHKTGLFFVVLSGIILIASLIVLPKTLSKIDNYHFFDIVEGKWTNAFESQFDEALLHYKPSVSFWNRLNLFFFKEGKDGVLIGKDGWLFTKEEYDYPKKYQSNVSENLSFIKSIQEYFQNENILLFVLPIPSKASLLENKARIDIPFYREGLYQELLKFLSNNKFNHIDLAGSFESPEELFLKTDTHWNQAGAQKAAQETAHYLHSTMSNMINWKNIKQSYFIEDAGLKKIEGDLTRYTAAQAFEKEEIRDTTAINSDAQDSLFGDINIPIHLVGTSYSANKNWGFEAFLKKALKTDVLNMADEGLGPFETMESYLKSSEYKTNIPALVIWEIPERFLPVNYNLNYAQSKKNDF